MFIVFFNFSIWLKLLQMIASLPQDTHKRFFSMLILNWMSWINNKWISFAKVNKIS